MNKYFLAVALLASCPLVAMEEITGLSISGARKLMSEVVSAFSTPYSYNPSIQQFFNNEIGPLMLKQLIEQRVTDLFSVTDLDITIEETAIISRIIEELKRDGICEEPGKSGTLTTDRNNLFLGETDE